MAIVVSHIASEFDALCRQALRQAPLADLIELRLDRIGNPGEEALRSFAKESPKPVIVACHGPETFGEFAGDIDERLDLLHTAARAGIKFVDVDYSLSLDLGELEGRCRRIVSRHETSGTPRGAGELEELWEGLRDVLYEGDISKLVTHAHSCEDGLALLAFLRTHPGLIGFTSGEPGSFTRVLCRIFGSAFTYAAPAVMPGMPKPEKTAPGQIRVNDLLGMLPPGGLTPETAIFGVVGNPARYSWSPRLHGMALKSAQLDAVYLPFEPDDFDAFLELATDENYRGFSVTAPFKERAYALAASRDQSAQDAKAANTLVREGKGWRAVNTDTGAVAQTLENAFRIHRGEPQQPAEYAELGKATILVLGTGGAARATLRAATRAGADVLVAGRRLEAATALADEFAARAIAWDEIESAEYDAVVNCTPLGSLANEGATPIEPDGLREKTVVIDAVYRPLRTPLLAGAIAKGCTAVPGAEWFVRQAQEQFQQMVGQPADAELMRAAFDHALGEVVPED